MIQTPPGPAAPPRPGASEGPAAPGKPASGPAREAGPMRVFVVGPPRGGTTLAQRLLAERLDLHTLPETRILANLYGNLEEKRFPNTARPRSALRRASSALREGLGLATGAAPVALPGLMEMPARRWRPARAAATEFVARMDAAAARAGRAGWLEKTPFHVHYAARIEALVPGAWTIHVIREARAVIGSIRDAARRYDELWPEVYDRVERDVDDWNAAVAASAAVVGRPRQVFVPYEALAAAPDPVLDEIARRLGAAAAPAGGAAARPAPILTVGAREAWKSEAGTGAVRPAASKWDTALTEDERARAEALIAPVPPALEDAMAPLRAAAERERDRGAPGAPRARAGAAP